MNLKMKAIVLHEHGGPEVLQFENQLIPEPQPGEVLIKLSAIALNHVDLFVRNGMPGIHMDYPHIPGADGAGIVVGLGKNTQGFSIGDRVVINANLGCGVCRYCLKGQDNLCDDWNLLGETTHGTYRQYITLPSRQLLKVPKNFDLHKAAAAALVYLTAWHSLVTRGGIQNGERVLIVGASGGVNTASIQIAKHFGAEIFVIGSSPEKLELAQSLGADHLIDRMEHEQWSREVYIRSGKEGVDIVVDNVGATFAQSIRSLRKRGRLLTVGRTAETNVTFNNSYVFARHLSIIGSTMGTIEDFNKVMDLVFKGVLEVPIDRTYPWTEVAEAHTRLEAGNQLGKITLEITED